MQPARLAVIAIVSACGSTPARVVAPPRDPTAAEIVIKLEATYANAKTYSDRGIVKNGQIARSFDTTFVRSSRFRFDLRDENEPKRGFVLWADGTHSYSRWYGPPRTTDDGPALGVTIAVAAKPSLGVVQTLAHLLEPTLVPGVALTGLKLEGSEPIDDHACWIVSGLRGDVETRLWIDRESFVLRRSVEDSDVASFTPVLGAAIDVAQVAPPDFSDDYGDDSSSRIAVQTLVGTRAPPFDAALLNGSGRTTLAALAGNVVVVDFWATWCGPCRKTLPRLNEWHHKYSDRGLRVVGLSSEDADDIVKLVTENALAYTIGRDEGAKAARAYKVTALPMLVVVDRTGVVRFVNLGAGNLDAVEAVIEGLLR